MNNRPFERSLRGKISIEVKRVVVARYAGGINNVGLRKTKRIPMYGVQMKIHEIQLISGNY